MQRGGSVILKAVRQHPTSPIWIFVPTHGRDIGVRTSPGSLIHYRGRFVARISQEHCYLNG
jgi:hypothetical protein